MAKPSGSIKSIKLPNDSTSHEIVPDKVGSGSYYASLPTLTADKTLATTDDIPQTYLKDASLSTDAKTLTITKKDGSTIDFQGGGGTTANDGKLTIQRNSTDIGTFTANQSTDTTINISASTTTWREW